MAQILPQADGGAARRRALGFSNYKAQPEYNRPNSSLISLKSGDD
jgi:hypothetical protein